MEVFIRNLPPRASEKILKREFKPYLERLSISDYLCQKKGKFATLTFLAAKDAQNFLRMHSQVDL
jgi:RNA recognition motif-containing protein